MKIKLFDSELKIMEILWKEGSISAKKIAEIIKEDIGWSKTTTYTVIKKCIDKDAIERIEPNFICHPLISREQAQEYETTELVEKMFNGSTDQLIASLVNNKSLTKQGLDKLKELIKSLD